MIFKYSSLSSLKGYRRLLNTDKTGLPRALKKNLSVVPIWNAQSDYDKKLELAIRQDFVQRLLARPFLKNCVASMGLNKPFIYPLPFEWRQVASRYCNVSLLSTFNWMIYCLIRHLWSCKKICEIVIHFIMRRGRKHICNADFIYLHNYDISRSLAPNTSGKEDFFKWHSINNSKHKILTAIGKLSTAQLLGPSTIDESIFPLTFMQGRLTLRKFFKVFIETFVDFFSRKSIPKYLQLIILDEIFIANVITEVEFNPKAVFFHYSGTFIRPLWSEKFHSVLWFYSTNNEGPMVKGRKDIGAGLNTLSFDEYMVWNEHQKRWLASFGISEALIKVAGPLGLYGRLPPLPYANEPYIAIFDVSPVKYRIAAEMAMVVNIYSYRQYTNFVVGIFQVIRDYRCSIFFFKKKDCPFSERVIRDVASMVGICEDRIKIFAENVSSLNAAENAKVSICFPFTSVAHYVPERSCYFFNSSLVESDDVGAGGIPFFNNGCDLKNFIDHNLTCR